MRRGEWVGPRTRCTVHLPVHLHGGAEVGIDRVDVEDPGATSVGELGLFDFEQLHAAGQGIEKLPLALVLLVLEVEGAQVAAVLALRGEVEVTGNDGEGLIGVFELCA